jgi:peroxiredoxin
MIRRLLLVQLLFGVVVLGNVGCAPGDHANEPTPSATSLQHPTQTRTPDKKLRVGDSAPDFTLDTLDGSHKVHLSDFPGKATLLVFWAITCSACIKQLPVIQRFHAQQRAQGSHSIILTVNIDGVDKFVDVARLQQKLGLTFAILVDDQFQARSIYQVTDVPMVFFIDRQHLVRAIRSGLIDESTLHRIASEAGV